MANFKLPGWYYWTQICKEMCTTDSHQPVWESSKTPQESCSPNPPLYIFKLYIFTSSYLQTQKKEKNDFINPITCHNLAFVLIFENAELFESVLGDFLFYYGQIYKMVLFLNIISFGGLKHESLSFKDKRRWLKHQWIIFPFSSVQSLSHVWLCNPMNRSTPGLPVHHQLPEFTQTHDHRVSDAIQPSHPLLSPSPPAHNPSQQTGSFPMSQLFAWGGQLLELQLQHQSFQWTPRTDLL